jgi:hypothetical protein
MPYNLFQSPSYPVAANATEESEAAIDSSTVDQADVSPGTKRKRHEHVLNAVRKKVLNKQQQG